MTRFYRRLTPGFVSILSSVVFSLYAGEPIGSAPKLVDPPRSFATPAPSVATTLSAPLFLKESVSVYTAHGVAGFVPGSPVRLLSTDTKTGKITVTDGQFQVEVALAQLTRDPSVAAELRRRQEAAQQATQAALRARLAVRAKAQQQFYDARERYQTLLYREELERELGGMSAYHGGIGFSGIYDCSYGLRGDPYHAAHQYIPRLDKSAPKPKNPLDEGRNSLGFY